MVVFVGGDGRFLSGGCWLGGGFVCHGRADCGEIGLGVL